MAGARVACRDFAPGRGIGNVLDLQSLWQVKIMMAHDPEGKMGPKMQLPDNVIVHEPKAGPFLQRGFRAWGSEFRGPFEESQMLPFK